MTSQLTSEFVWHEIEKEIFAVLGMVTSNNESRTVGIIYVVRNGRFYISSSKEAWKVKHIAQNPQVSMTIPIHKHVPFMPWIKIPAATITFSGVAQILEPEETPTEIVQAIFRGMAENETLMAESCLIEVKPVKEFITYGVGISLMQMRDPKLARGRVLVSAESRRFDHIEKIRGD
jgi:hypothetical protein